MSANVSYKAKNLFVEFTGLTEELVDLLGDTLCCEVDLKDYLTEWVIFWFSASTAFRYQSHTLKTWSFSSDLDLDGLTIFNLGPNESDTPTGSTPNGNGEGKKTNKKLIIRLLVGIIGGLSILILVGMALWIHSNNKPGPNKHPDSGRRSPNDFLTTRKERSSRQH
ncbi:hypothetical protein LINGRAHAP2_LOCUS32242 [Linum grandiflorum]